MWAVAMRAVRCQVDSVKYLHFYRIAMLIVRRYLGIADGVVILKLFPNPVVPLKSLLFILPCYLEHVQQSSFNANRRNYDLTRYKVQSAWNERKGRIRAPLLEMKALGFVGGGKAGAVGKGS